MEQPANLEKILLEAVDEGLLVPGEIVRAAIYERLERSYQIKRGEIPEKLETFHLALQDLLGEERQGHGEAHRQEPLSPPRIELHAA